MLRIRGLEKGYDGRPVLRGVDLDAAAGEIVGLLGPNGAGKTTLVSIVAGLRRPDAGSVEVDGIDALTHPQEARALLGLAPQELGIYPTLTVRQNLELFARVAGARGAALARQVGTVAEALDLAPLLRQRAGTLSGGQKRRLHTAMALVTDARLLFLDEPTAGADVITRGQILDVVRERATAGCAVVYTSHYLGEIEELGATVAVLEEGRIIARSSLNELIARHGSPALRLTFAGPAPSLPGFSVEGSVATLRTPDPAHDAAVALTRLNGAAERLSGIEILRPSLEAAYLALTGRRSNEDVASALQTTPNPNSHEDSDELVA